MRITFVISTLQNGGAERVLVNMANYWAKRGHEVEIVSLASKSDAPFYELGEAVVYSPLSLAQKTTGALDFVGNNLRRIKVIREAIRRSNPDVVISFMDRMNVMVALATIGLDVPVVLSERNDPAQYKIGGLGWEWLRKLTYPLADSVVVQTHSALSYFSPGIRKRAAVIPNGVSFPAEAAAPFSSRHGGHKLVAVGRLADQKGFDLLLSAFAQIRGQFPQWSLTVWGEGPERGALEKQRESLGLTGCVHFPGRTKTPFKEMKEADLLVLSSRYEGFPNALLEAMACGLAVISFDCPSGPGEIIRHDVDGVLVPPLDVNALAKAMSRLMGDAALRSALSARAKEVVQRFNMEGVMKKWEDVFDKLQSTPSAKVPFDRDTETICH
jgi:GalNAc-alpha-(1->4)-GalNAc-alpha-(1->3)-diNAcBac-PP-undecaprenol alpha-1,4-N-acetyl-D-galactosaminyltransferase